MALRDGFKQPWRDIDGQGHDRLWGVAELVQRRLVAGVAPWGSPAPGPGAELDSDSSRGITGTPDEAALWTAWNGVAKRLEETNGAGSSQCLGFVSWPPLT